MEPTPAKSDEFVANAFCNRCGYDLRSNNISGPCPECGLALSYASFSSGLSETNPLWLHRIYLGITGIAVAQSVFAFQSATLLLAILSRSEDMQFFFLSWSKFYGIGYAIQWFSALFLLAARENHDDHESTMSPRRLLLWVGGTSVVLGLIGPLIPPIIRMPGFLSHLVTLVDVAAVICLFLYVLRLAQRDGHPLVKRHLPIAVTLLIVNVALQFLLPFGSGFGSGFRRIDDVTSLINTAVAVYLVYVLLQMRRSIGSLLTGAKADPPIVS